jgi:hypothetical protein
VEAEDGSRGKGKAGVEGVQVQGEEVGIVVRIGGRGSDEIALW